MLKSVLSFVCPNECRITGSWQPEQSDFGNKHLANRCLIIPLGGLSSADISRPGQSQGLLY